MTFSFSNIKNLKKKNIFVIERDMANGNRTRSPPTTTIHSSSTYFTY
jgi:hypothetical protein